MKKIINTIICFFLILAVIVGAIIAYLSVSEFMPDEREEIDVSGSAARMIKRDERSCIMTWNIGYGALGDNADFFMDGGRMVYTADRDRVCANLDGIAREIDKVSPDILFTQELDLGSSRSYFIDESDYLIKKGKAEVLHGERACAINFLVPFVPLPIPPIGKVNGGIEIFSGYDMSGAGRVSLPCPFKWPLRTFNLKRCLEVARLSVEGTDRQLVLINLHLEAYDSGEGKIAQTRVLKDILQKEVDAGNYVIVGGDFNQVFSNIDVSAYPVLEGKWEAGSIDVDEFDDRFSFHADERAPSCRSLDRALSTAESRDPADFQYYVIDGFIVSSNVEVESVTTDDLGFVSSDHNPVIMYFKLK